MKNINLSLFLFFIGSYCFGQNCYEIGDSKLDGKLIQDTTYVKNIISDAEEVWESEIRGSILEFKNGKLFSYKNSKPNFKICERDIDLKHKKIFSIEVRYGELEYNHNKENKWLSNVDVAGEKLNSGDKITVSVSTNDSIKISCYLEEYNEEYNDFAETSFFLNKKTLEKYRNDGFSIPLIVEESRGKYAGNKAQMNFYFFIK